MRETNNVAQLNQYDCYLYWWSILFFFFNYHVLKLNTQNNLVKPP